jgi:hypothetical protein
MPLRLVMVSLAEIEDGVSERKQREGGRGRERKATHPRCSERVRDVLLLGRRRRSSRTRC